LGFSVINGELAYATSQVPRSSFSIAEDKVSIIFRYFEVLNLLFSVVDKLKIQNRYILIPLKVGFVASVFLLNYLLIMHKSFLKVVMFIIMINYTRSVFKKPNTDDLIICIKRW
jgi:hypothetical protein